jgi:hypothetical protein
VSQTTGNFPALYDNQKRKPKVTPLPIHKVIAPPMPKKKKGA